MISKYFSMNRFASDEKGAAFLEYTVLLAVILAVSIVTVLNVGTWASGIWTALDTKLATVVVP